MSIRVEIELDDGSFSTRMLHAGESVAQFERNVGQGVTSVAKLNETTTTFLGTLRDVTVTFGMARAAIENIRAVTTGWAGDIIKTNAEMEKLTFLLRGMSSAKDPLKEAGEQVKFLREQAVQAPFSLHALTDTFVKMKSTGIDPMAGAFKGMIDAVAAFGGTDDVLKRATIAITQMSGKGVIQMEELRQQLGEAVPRAVELMARSLGVSTGQLIQTISKGTLDAKTSLQALQLEFDMTFGGAAAAQMKTFNGLISQTTTLFQGLSLKAGEAGFFDAVKLQLTDLNTSLNGPIANKFASDLGSGLGKVVGGFREALDWVIKFRQEILLAGEVMIAAFAVKAGIGAMAGIIGIFGSLKLEARALGLAFSAMSNSWALAAAGFASQGPMIGGASVGISRFAQVTQVASSAFMAFGAAAAFTASTVVPIVGILLAVGMAFGLFSDKLKDTWEEMERFGAQSRKQADEGDKYVKRLEAQVALLKTIRDDPYGAMSNGEGGGSDQFTAEANAAEDLKAARLKQAQNRIEAERNEDEKLLRIERDAMSDRQSAARAARDIEGKEQAETWVKELAELAKNHGDNKAATLKNQQAKRESDLAFLDLMYLDLVADIERRQIAVDSGDKNAALIFEKRNAEIVKAQRENREKYGTLASMPIGPQTAPKLDDFDKLLDKAKAKLDDIKSVNAGLRAELSGVSGEYAKLAYMINEATAKGKFMGNSNEEVRAVTAALLEQQKVKDEYDQKINAQNKISAELERLSLKAKTASLEAQTANMTDSEKFMVMLRAGAFNGLTAAQNLKNKWSDVKDTVSDTGEAMKKAFEAAMQPGKDMALVLDGVGKAFKGLPSESVRFDTPAPFSFSGTGSSYKDMVTRIESNGNNNATNRNSSATGPGQFIEETWLRFLKEMHPDMLAAGEKAALALRTNRDLSGEGIDWLAGKSRAKFEANGIEASNRNLYLGHFLGETGATSALTKPDDTFVTAIAELRAAIKANPEVFSKLATVGDLKAWAEGKTARGPTQTEPKLSAQDQRAFDAIQIDELANKAIEGARKLAEARKALDTGIEENETADAGKLTNLAKAIKDIKDGKGPLGVDNRDSMDPVFDSYLKLAAKKDASDQLYTDRAKTRKEIEAAQARKLLEDESLDLKESDLNNRLSNEQKFKFSGAYYSNVKQLQKEQALFDKGVANGTATPGVSADFLAGRKANVDKMRDNEIEAVLVGEQQKTIAIERGLLTTDEARESNFQFEVRRQEQLLALYSGTGEQRVIIERQITRNIAALRRQQFDLTPFGAMLKGWRDIAHNMETASVGWMNGFNDKLADMVMKGKADFKSLADQIIKDLIKIALQWAEMKLITSVIGMGSGIGATPGSSGLAAIHHTGGVAGTSMPMRQVDFSAFIGAPRFHTGGFPGMSHGEVPIIAMKGEEVGWPDQLAKKYGGGGGVAQTNHFDIKVQGSAGTPVQNQDLAEKIGAQMKEQAQALVADQLRLQMRPGGMLRGGR